MATFAPSSNLYVLNVPFDNTYRNQLYFATESAQSSWFMGRVSQLFTNFLVIRKVLPTGGMRSSVKVESNIDALYGSNYIMYQNANHGNKWFYAFITQLIYVNEETTEIVFETDVWQTWMFDVAIKPSFVVREHSSSDAIGANVVPEPFECNDYTYSFIRDMSSATNWGYLVALSNPADEAHTGERGKLLSGIYQGLYFYFFEIEHADTQLSVFLNGLDEDSVQFITVIPQFCIPSKIGPTDSNPNVSTYYVQEGDSPSETDTMVEFDYATATFEGYTPKNNKLYTSPFVNLAATNHAGNIAMYAVEEFTRHKRSAYVYDIQMAMYGDISSSPSIFLYPRYYKGLPHALEFGITMGDFPQCSYANDAFKLWMAKNKETIGVNVTSNAVNAMLGMGTIGYGAGLMGNPATATMGVGAISSGASQTLNGITGILQTWASVKSAEHMSNRTIAGCPKSNLLTAMGRKTLSLYKRSIRYDHAKTIDDYFTMFGYQTNKVKTPNLTARPYYNYVQTNGVNIIGGIPNDDMTRLKRMFDEGVTMWKSNATVGDYSVDNSLAE